MTGDLVVVFNLLERAAHNATRSVNALGGNDEKASESLVFREYKEAVGLLPANRAVFMVRSLRRAPGRGQGPRDRRKA